MSKESAQPGWRPDELLRNAASRRGMTVEQYRSRIRKAVEQSRIDGPHLTLQSAKAAAGGGNLADDELAHLDGCRFCGHLVANIDATEERVAVFDEAIRRAIESRRRAEDDGAGGSTVREPIIAGL